MTEPRKNATKTRGRPFQPGNAGRPKGSRHRATIAAELLLDGEAEALTRTAIELAKAGDSTALRLVFERILPPRKDRPVRFNMPLIKSASDAAKAMGGLLSGVAAGDLTPAEAAEVGRLVETYIRALEATELDVRLAELEEKLK